MLFYDETPPSGPKAPPTNRRRPTDAHAQSLGSVLSILARRAPWIVGCAILCASLALIAVKAKTPRYTAEAQIYIDPRDLRLVEKELTPAGQDATGYLTIVESQAQVITSSNVLGRSVAELRLAQDPEFVGAQGGWLAVLGWSQAGQETLAAFRESLNAVPIARLGGMAIAALGMQETVDLMIDVVRDHHRPGRPLYMTSANGEVLSRHARNPDFARLFMSADLVNADRQPMVLLSRLVGSRSLPERVAITDVFQGVAREAAARGLSFYLFGANEDENRRAVENVQALYPTLRIVGRSHGYLDGEALTEKLAEIDALAPGILWLALSVPLEQAFVHEHGTRLRHVGTTKTSGGLFNFLSDTRTRAPVWMQRAGMEWARRLRQEPTRLFRRYAVTNPHAIGLVLTRGPGSAFARGTGRLARALLSSWASLARR